MASVRLVEVGPRDGLQNTKSVISTATKIELIRRLRSCGLKTIEATSFVSPKWVPQLADGAQVMSGIGDIIGSSDESYPVLVPNLKGLEAALKAGAREVAVFVSASEGFSRRNNNASVDDALKRAGEVARRVKGTNVKLRGYISSVIACPFDGPTHPNQVLKVTQTLLDMGCYEISLGDTTGVGTPAQVKRLLETILASIPASQIAGHFHDTYGQALANVLVAYQMGIRVFDCSIAGLGGCPYAPGAKGNLATEDVAYMFEKMGVQTGVKLDMVAEVGSWISGELKIPSASRAGPALLATRNRAARDTTRKIPAGVPTLKWSVVKDHETYLVERAGSNMRITLARPRNGNALTLAMLSSLTQLIQAAAGDKEIRCIIITAKGKYFCTGMDISPSGATSASDRQAKEDQFHGLRNLFDAIDNAPQTTVAMITGPCLGGGVGLAMACDVRIAIETATFTLSETKLGLVPAVISKYLIREWGIPRSREAMLTARPVGCQELLDAGVIHGVAPDAASLTTLMEDKIFRIQQCAPGASAQAKDLVRVGWKFPGSTKQDATISDIYYHMTQPSQEAQYGLASFRAGNRNVDWSKMTRTTTKL